MIIYGDDMFTADSARKMYEEEVDRRVVAVVKWITEKIGRWPSLRRFVNLELVWIF